MPLGLQRQDTQQRSAKTKCVKPNTFMRQWPCTVACVEAEHPRRYVRSQLLSCDDNHALFQEFVPGIYGHELRNICLHFQALRFIVRRPLGLQRKDTQKRSSKTKCVKPNTFMRQYIHMFRGPQNFAALVSASCSCLATPLKGAPPWAGGWRLLESPCLDRALAPRPLRCRVTKTGEEFWWVPA